MIEITISNMIELFFEYFLVSGANSIYGRTFHEKKYHIASIMIIFANMFVYAFIGLYASILFWLCLFILTFKINRNPFLSGLSITLSVYNYFVTRAIVIVVFSKFITHSLEPTPLSSLIIYLAYILSTVFTIFLWKFFEKRITRKNKYLIFFLAFLLYGIPCSIVLFGSIFALRKERERKQMEEELSNMQLYIESLENTNKKIRVFKHDYQNILLSIETFLAEENYDDLKRYFSNQMIPTLNELDFNTLKSTDLDNLKILELKSILIQKVLYAQSKNISVTIEIPEIISSIQENTVRLVRCLGIILDNAIEGCSQLEEKKINIGLLNKETTLEFIVENSCNDNIPPLHKLKEYGFSTKGENRGIGLNSLEKMISQSKNLLLETQINPPIFTQIVRIRRETNS